MSEEKLSIQFFTNPILHKPCEPITEINDELIDLIGKMFVYMQQNNGVGLSANQIGISKQLCVASLENNTKMMAFINPKIISHGKEKEILKEGCLSSPGILANQKRYKEIVVECLNIKGEKEQYKLTGLDARILQHEIDHLSGCLILDHYKGYWNILNR